MSDKETLYTYNRLMNAADQNAGYALLDAVNELDALRARIAELEGTWILCSERVPEEEGYEFWETKLVLVDWDKLRIAAMHWQGGWYSNGHDWTKHVIAWRDMPQITNPPEAT